MFSLYLNRLQLLPILSLPIFDHMNSSLFDELILIKRLNIPVSTYLLFKTTIQGFQHFQMWEAILKK